MGSQPARGSSQSLIKALGIRLADHLTQRVGLTESTAAGTTSSVCFSAGIVNSPMGRSLGINRNRFPSNGRQQEVPELAASST
jgi:hypothetical protein